MIALETLCAQIENALNDNTAGLRFRIFGDTDNYFEAQRRGNSVTEYINGLLQIVQANTVPTQALTVATQTARLEFVFPIEQDEQEEIQALLRAVRGAYDAAYSRAQVEAMTDESGVVFSVAVQATPLTTGERNFRQRLGDSMSMVAYFYYSFIENGVNSYNVTVSLDGVLLPYDSFTVSRVPTTESNPYSDGDGAAKNRMVSSGISFDMTLPATRGNAAGTAILDFILSGGDATHTLTVNNAGTETVYSVILGETNISLAGINNAGYRVSFVEATNYGL